MNGTEPNPSPHATDNGDSGARARTCLPEGGQDGRESGDSSPERTECPRTHCEPDGCEQASSQAGGDCGASGEAVRQNPTQIALGLTDNQRAFLAGYVVSGTVTGGARAAEIHRDTHYHWMATDDVYKVAFESAVEEAADLAEEAARRRAFQGVRKYKFLKDGSPVLHPLTGEPYYEIVCSDALALSILRALRPQKYRDNVSVEHSSGPVPIVEDEQWYGNAAHALSKNTDQAAETAPAPVVNPTEPGPV